MPYVMTVRGPVEPTELGMVDAHEHLFLRTPAQPGEEYWDPEKSTQEALAVAQSGIGTIVDLTTIGLGRRPLATAELSRRAGIHVVAATGVHRSAHYSATHWVHEVDEPTLLDV